MPHVGFLCCRPRSSAPAPVWCSAALILHPVPCQSSEPPRQRSSSAPKCADRTRCSTMNASRTNPVALVLEWCHPSVWKAIRKLGEEWNLNGFATQQLSRAFRLYSTLSEVVYTLQAAWFDWQVKDILDYCLGRGLSYWLKNNSIFMTFSPLLVV